MAVYVYNPEMSKALLWVPPALRVEVRSSSSEELDDLISSVGALVGRRVDDKEIKERLVKAGWSKEISAWVTERVIALGPNVALNAESSGRSWDLPRSTKITNVGPLVRALENSRAFAFFVGCLAMGTLLLALIFLYGGGVSSAIPLFMYAGLAALATFLLNEGFVAAFFLSESPELFKRGHVSSKVYKVSRAPTARVWVLVLAVVLLIAAVILLTLFAFLGVGSMGLLAASAAFYAWTYMGNRVAQIKRSLVVPAEIVQGFDSRPPVVFLRSFKDDWIEVHTRKKVSFVDLKLRLEEVVAEQLWKIGPVVAIGKPGEDLPELGASREYVDGDAWMERVESLVESAKTIVILPGSTAGVEWEISKALELNALHKVLLVCPPIASHFTRALANLCGQVDEAELADSLHCFRVTEYGISWKDKSRMVLAYFDSAGHPQFISSNSLSIDDYRIAINLWRKEQSRPKQST